MRPARRPTAFSSTLVGTVCLAIGLLCPVFALAAATEAPKPDAATKAPAPPKKVEIARTREAWSKAMDKLPQPKEGCYTAEFPRVEWKSVACGEAPKYPMIPAHGKVGHFVVGGGLSNDFSAHPTGTINAIEGTFVSISSGLIESGPIANTPPNIDNAYTLQINANQFVSSICPATSTDCAGWEQFVYENNDVSHRVFIQYWLIKFNATCPSSAWTQFQFTGDTDIYCFQSTTTASLPAGVDLPVSGFGTVTFSAKANATSDQVKIEDGLGHAATRVGTNAVALSGGWTDAEFNVFGDAGNSDGGGQAGFGTNSTIVVKTTVHNGTKNAPTCVAESFTGETNNLTLVGTAAISTQQAPAIEFTQSNVAGSTAACQTAAGIGDTHLTTFGGLLYDFQAAGDFVLAESGPDFMVQARQVSGAPTWPNATVNKAVATRMGNTRVVFCTAPGRVNVDGSGADIADGQVMSLPTGVDIRRTANAYVVIDQRGNSLRAELQDTHINATVGLGKWPTDVRGVLANARTSRNTVNKIQARTGAILTAPFPYNRLYHEYADSWRVAQGESLLSPCGENVETGIPRAPFYARNLDRDHHERGRTVCTAAGVKPGPLFEACILDVAVIGKDEAAQVFVGARAPKAVGRVVQ